MIIIKENKRTKTLKESDSGLVNSNDKKLFFTALQKEFTSDVLDSGVPELALIGTAERAIRSIPGWMFMSYQDKLMGRSPDIQRLKRKISITLNQLADQIGSMEYTP
jgi:hypothetical protein